MEENSTTKKCTNCRQEISLTAYELHVSRCWRFTFYCDLCEEPVPKDERESHMEECHTSKPCELCGQSVAPGQAEQHQDECVEGMVVCKYCELETKRKFYSEHVEACGGRTEVCEKCSLRVRLKDMQEHLDMKCGHMRSEPPLDQHTLAHLDSLYDHTSYGLHSHLYAVGRPSRPHIMDPPSRPHIMDPPSRPHIMDPLSRPHIMDPPSCPHTMDPPSHAPTNVEMDEQWVESVGGVCGDELDSLVAQNMFYLDATRPEPPHSPSASPPATDADFELARRLQEEEERRDRVFEMDQNLAKQLQEDESTHSYPSHSSIPPPTYRGSSPRTQEKEKRKFRRDPDFFPQHQPADSTLYDTPHTSTMLPPPHTFTTSPPPHTSTAFPNEEVIGSSVSGDEEFARRLQLEEDKLQYSTSTSYHHSPAKHSPSPPTTDDLLPCQFCNQLFPAHRLTLHQNSCGREGKNNPVEKDHVTTRAAMRQCVYCEALVPELDCSIHEALCEKNPDTHLSNAYPASHPLPSTPSPPTLPHIETSDIPCEICDNLFSLSDIHKHEVVCRLKTSRMNSVKTSSRASSQTSSSAARPSHPPHHTASNPRGEQPRRKSVGRSSRQLAIRFPRESGLSVSGQAISSKRSARPNGHTHEHM